MSTQISEKLSLLFVNVRKMKKKTWVGNGKVFCALLRGLSKTFDCLDHELLTTKLNTYSFNLPALRLIHDYFSNIKLVKKLKILIAIGWKLYLGISQGSLLRTLLFNIFIVDLFFNISDTVVVPLFGGCHSIIEKYRGFMRDDYVLFAMINKQSSFSEIR